MTGSTEVSDAAVISSILAAGCMPLLRPPGSSAFPPDWRGVSVLGSYPRAMLEKLTKFSFDNNPRAPVTFAVMLDDVEVTACREVLNFMLRFCEGDQSYDLFKAVAVKKLDYEKFGRTLRAVDRFGIPAVDEIITNIYGANIRDFDVSATVALAGRLPAGDPKRQQIVSYLGGYFAAERETPGSPKMLVILKDAPGLGDQVVQLMLSDP